jgi:pyridoxal phosphate enzyme (YggS family)
MEKNEILNNIQSLRQKIRQAERAAGRPEGQVQLLAATKTVSAEDINFAIREGGLTDIGENRVQELLSKYDALDKEGVRIHFIGTLQTNKVKYIVDKVDLIHSVDSLKLAKEIDRRAAAIGKVQDILLEYNSGGEENKSGFSQAALYENWDEIAELANVRVLGIMTIAPKCEKNTEYCKFFAKTYQIFLDFLQKKPHNRDVSVLSMGMSDSFVPAIACGATVVRVGSRIFGARHYPEKIN